MNTKQRTNLTPITWLQLSNLNIGYRRQGRLWPHIREILHNDIVDIHKQTGDIDIIFLAGDITQTGELREFELAASELERIWETLRRLGSQPILLVVPGNHDLRRQAFDSIRGIAKHPQAKLGEQYKVRQTLSWGSHSSLQKAFDTYSAWYSLWRRQHQLNRTNTRVREISWRNGLLPGDFAASYEKEGTKFGVVGLNSVPFVEYDRRDDFRLELGQLQAVCGKNTHQWHAEHNLSIIMAHHHINGIEDSANYHAADSEDEIRQFQIHIHSGNSKHNSPISSHRFSSLSLASPHFLGSITDRLSGAEQSEDDTAVDKPELFGGYLAGSVGPDDTHRVAITKVWPRGIARSQSGTLMITANHQYPLSGDGSMHAEVPYRITRNSQSSTIRHMDETHTNPDSIPIQKEAAAYFGQPGVTKIREEPIQNRVTQLAWSPDGKTLAIGTDSGRIYYWLIDNNQTIQSKQVLHGRIVALEFSKDGKRLLAASTDGDLDVIDAYSGTNKKLTLPLFRENTIFSAIWDPQSTYIYVGLLDGMIAKVDLVSSSVEHVFHMGSIEPYCLSISPFGNKLIAGDSIGRINVFDINSGVKMYNSEGHHGPICAFAWQPGKGVLASAGTDRTIRIWDIDTGRAIHIVEGHLNTVTSLSFLSSGQILASKSHDSTIRFWRCDNWHNLGKIEEESNRMWFTELAFHPTRPLLASLGTNESSVRLWSIELAQLLAGSSISAHARAYDRYVSAKVVLVGESNVGKSCLASRLAEKRYQELGTTHAMRFCRVSFSQLDPETQISANEHRELIFWDMGGQNEYRLIHQLFLHNTVLALLLLDPTRGIGAFEEIDGWNKSLDKQHGNKDTVKFLVGTKLDKESDRQDSAQTTINEFIHRNGIAEYFATSAKTGYGVSELSRAIANRIDWSRLGYTNRPELFQEIRKTIEKIQETGRAAIPVKELEKILEQSNIGTIERDALDTVIMQLASQGRIADSRMPNGDRILILQIEQIEAYAGSLVMAARENPRGIPAIELRMVGAQEIRFPGITSRLSRADEHIVVDCVVQMLLEHGVALMHEGLLIFPSLFRVSASDRGDSLRHAISLFYDFSGAIDNIYSSLVVILAVSRTFGKVLLWKDRAEFQQLDQTIAGIRKTERHNGTAHLDIYFGMSVSEGTRNLFIVLIEEHLQQYGVDIAEQISIKCSCGVSFPETILRERLADGHIDIGCQRCDLRIPIILGAQQAREQTPGLNKTLRAIRTRIELSRTQNVYEAKAMLEQSAESLEPSSPIRILHLSDLHIGINTDPRNLLEGLTADIRDSEDGLGYETLDYIVISGDITNHGNAAEFEKAREFISELISPSRFGLSAERCILVPGNHDLSWDEPVYTWKQRRLVDSEKLPPETYIEQGSGLLIRDEARYPERFKNFSQLLFHPVLQQSYPIDQAEQGMSFLFPATKLQFITLNSSWMVDEYFPDRSGINENALSRVLDKAREQVSIARQHGQLSPTDRLLRIAVLHHPISGNEKIIDDGFVERLQKAGIRLCMHGHVHEDRADLVGYLRPTRSIHVLGAGSFGAPTFARPEAVPRLYNLVEIQRDLTKVRVHTRRRQKSSGAWSAWAVWPGTDPSSRRGYYEIDLIP